LNILLLDNSGTHTTQRLRWPENVRCVWLPPYGPELNPIERVRRALKADLAWLPFFDLDVQQVSIWATYDRAMMRLPSRRLPVTRTWWKP